MGEFPTIQYAERLPSGKAGAVPWNINVDTGAGAVGNALAQLGDNLARIGEKHRQANNALEYSSMKRRYDELGSAAITGLQNVSDEKEAQKVLEQYRSDVGSIQSDNKEVNQEFEIHVNNTITGWTDNFSNLIERNKVRKLNDEFEVNYQGMLEKGDYTGADELLGNLQVAGAITQIKADTKRKSFFGDTLLAQSDRLINLGDSASLQRAEGILTNLPKLKTADGKPIEFSGQQLEVMDNLRTKLLSTQNRSNSALKQQQEKETFDLYGKSEDGTLTWDMLKVSVIPADEKQEIWRNFKVAQAQKINTGISQIEEGDPTVLAQVNAIVDLRPNDISPEQIYRLVDKGLGTKHVPTVVDRLKRNQKEANPVNSKYRAELGRLHTKGLFGKLEKKKTSDTFLKLQSKLDTFLATNPSDEQAQKFFSTLIREDVSWGHSFGANELPGFGETPLSVEITTKEGQKTTAITFGDIIEIDGEFYQATGRKDGQVEWRKVNPR